MHTDTALSCILLNNTQHTPVNSLSTLTILWFERKALIQTSVKFALHCTNNNNVICALYIFFSRDYYSYSSYPVTTRDPSAEKWVPISYKLSLLQYYQLVRKFWTWNYGVATGNFPCFQWQQYRHLQFDTLCCQWCERPASCTWNRCLSDNNTSWTLKPGHQKY